MVDERGISRLVEWLISNEYDARRTTHGSRLPWFTSQPAPLSLSSLSEGGQHLEPSIQYPAPGTPHPASRTILFQF
jgi:hypothetical protein